MSATPPATSEQAMFEQPTFDRATIDNTHRELSRSVMALVREEPFFGHLLAGLNRDVGGRTPTAAVAIRSNRPLLIVNPDFFTKTITRKDERTAVVKHEALHLLLAHLFRIDWAHMDRQIYNLAADLVVNQFIGRKWPLPDGAITLETFPELRLAPDLSVEAYYNTLMANHELIPPELVASHSDHRGWGEASSDAERALARQELARLARTARDRAGRSFALLDDPVKMLVQALIEELEPTIDWRRVLRMFSNSSRRTRVANTMRRPSKRYGTYPGIRVKRMHSLAVIVDTSGSISDHDLAEFFGEIHGIWRQGSEITIVEADQIVQRVSTYRGHGPPDTVAGRGGTSFDEALQYVADARRPFDAAIYLTDGVANEPQVRPRCKVLWVLPEDGQDQALAFGRVVRISR